MRQSTIALLVLPPVLAIQIAAVVIVVSGNKEDAPAKKPQPIHVEPTFKPIPVLTPATVAAPDPPPRRRSSEPDPIQHSIPKTANAPRPMTEDEITVMRFTVGASACMSKGVSAEESKEVYLAIVDAKNAGHPRENAILAAAVLCDRLEDKEQCQFCLGAMIGAIYEELP